MRQAKSVFLSVQLSLMLILAGEATAEVFVRWDQNRILTPAILGVSTVVVPASNGALIHDALAQGYRLFLELDGTPPATSTLPAARIAGIVVSGTASRTQAAQLQKQVGGPGVRLFKLEGRGVWPHIRTNWVTSTDGVLQVTSRTAQPWIESNAALVRIAQASKPDWPALLTFSSAPVTGTSADQAPTLEHYLIAVAEAGSVGADLMLPLHEGFQQKLLMGEPRARLEWDEIRRHIEFVSWDLTERHKTVANVAVVAASPAQSHEVLNLLLRHNVPFELVTPGTFRSRNLDPFDLLLVLDPIPPAHLDAATAFARRGGTLVVFRPDGNPPWRAGAALAATDQRRTYRFEKGIVVELTGAIADPNAFALEARQLLGPERRVLDIWNGITVLAFPYENPTAGSLLITLVNYACQAMPVQLRVRGTFSTVYLESPEEALSLLANQQRNGYTEFVIPALRTTGRVFLAE